MVTTNFTRHENETKVFDELLLCIQIIKPLKEFCHKVMLHPTDILKANTTIKELLKAITISQETNPLSKV